MASVLAVWFFGAEVSVLAAGAAPAAPDLKQRVRMQRCGWWVPVTQGPTFLEAASIWHNDTLCSGWDAAPRSCSASVCWLRSFRHGNPGGDGLSHTRDIFGAACSCSIA
jgi:hypothetical protein